MRIILLVIDGFGLGAFPDALNRSVELYGRIIKNAKLPHLKKLGIYNINNPRARIGAVSSYGSLKSLSSGSDVITLYFELAGLCTKIVYPTYPKGLPKELIKEIEAELKTNIIGNIVADGERVINDLGALHYNTGFPIIYTSRRSVMYVAAHEEIMPLNRLYDICLKLRGIMQGKNNIARIMASPFQGKINKFNFSDNNRCYTVLPPSTTILDMLRLNGIEVIAIGKIGEIFNGQGISRSYESRSNENIFKEIYKNLCEGTEGLIFANIEAADMSRDDDVDVYTRCLEDIDLRIGELLSMVGKEDIVIMTSNHSYETFNVEEEQSAYSIPLIVYGNNVKSGINLKTIDGLDSVAHTIMDYFNISDYNKSFLDRIVKQ